MASVGGASIDDGMDNVELTQSQDTGYRRYRDLPHRSFNETLKTHSSFAVKLSETAVDFLNKVAAAEEQHAQQLMSIVKNYRKKTADNLKKDPLMVNSTGFSAWESLIGEVERESRSCTQLSQKLTTSVSQQLSDLTARKKSLIKKWFAFRDVYMGRVDKMEDFTGKMYREYQDQWTKYAEALEKGEEAVKDSMVLHSYNTHNDYVMQLAGFNHLHDEFYGKQVFDMLNELQAVHEDLVKGFKHCLQKRIQYGEEKLKTSLSHLSDLQQVLDSISAPADISTFVTNQNVLVKEYPPPPCQFKAPDLPTPKLPDTPPVDLSPLEGHLQLVDMTQAPLIHAHEGIKKNESDVATALEQLHKEYQSVKTLLDSYRDNPALGDPNSLIEELLEMRNKIRIKEVELIVIRGKLSLFTHLNVEGASPIGSQISMEENSLSPTNLSRGRPIKTSTTFVLGRSHEFLEDERKIRKLQLCSYCKGVIQPPISRGFKCKVCKTTVHIKCQNYIPYCEGLPPTKDPAKFAASVSKVTNRLSMLLQRKTSNAPSSSGGSPTGSFDGYDEDETLGGLYELPPQPPTRTPSRKTTSPEHLPKPPPRGESLYSRAEIEDALTHHSFEQTVELADSYSYCVAMYDYTKVNPNDVSLMAGDVIALINTASGDWWKGSVGDKKGYFPATYVQLVSRGNIIMRAIYDYSPLDSGEIPLEEGQIVIQTRCEGDGWLFGKSGVDNEGLFPENYVQKLDIVS
ncbi:uncharacterized protein LOC135333889 isoform X2 [Halichondria panicea]|uniref:uncharacterized protein LOC135333889 isoform X2 n=1 Tax=Halichondria panicea TaxID=6063 RepID=UPI00312B83DB